MHSDARHSIIYNRETRRTVEFKLMKGYAVTTNDGLESLQQHRRQSPTLGKVSGFGMAKVRTRNDVQHCQALGKCEQRPRRASATCLLEPRKYTRGTLPNAGDGEEKLDLSHTAAGNVKGYSPSRKELGRLFKNLPYNPAITVLGMSPRDVKIDAHANPVRSSFIRNSQRFRTTERSFCRSMVKQRGIHPCSSGTERNEV